MLGWQISSHIDTASYVHSEQIDRVIPIDPYGEQTYLNLIDAEASGDPDKIQVAIEQLAERLDYDRKWIYGGSRLENYEQISDHARQHGSAGFARVDLPTSLDHPSTLPTVFWLFAGIILLWWLIMMICQGEGLEIDIQRRRHPHWEWLLSHPVRPVAAFTAELLGPLAANPIYLTAPVFWFFIFKSALPLGIAILLALPIGFGFAIATSCLNKTIEISAMLRLPAQRRGLLLGLVSWAGYAAMILPLFSIRYEGLIASICEGLLPLATAMPELQWPFRAILIGWSDSPSAWQISAAHLLITGTMSTVAIALARWSTKAGLQASQSSNQLKPSRTARLGSTRGWLRNPYYQKEWLWLCRDKGAVVQIILIPLTMAGIQAINFGTLSSVIGESWNFLCGVAILAGTYFLLVLGPRSLTSEGSALWIAQTWPHGLEDLLKAKARLWFGIASVVVGGLLICGICLFPQHWWQIALVAGGWWIAGSSLSRKAVTLVTASSSSGEPEKPSRGRQWAAMLGTFTFAGGVMAKSWHVAAIGLVFSVVTSVTMWQSLRARLPYLFDPWSEKLPRPPSLLHSVVGIAIMVELVGLATAISTGYGGEAAMWKTRSIAYGAVGLLTMLTMWNFLHDRAVYPSDIWRWPRVYNAHIARASYVIAPVVAVALAALTYGYWQLLSTLPATSAYLTKLADLGVKVGSTPLGWGLVLPVLLAPLAEEYLFRGLLYRSLQRETSHWRAVLGSAAFFAVYHPPIYWLPMFLLGVLSAMLFRRTGRLFPCLLLHVIYQFLIRVSM